MPNVTAPAISLDAHGTLARQLTFIKTARGTAVKRRARVPKPTHAWARANQLLFAVLPKLWATLSTGERANWTVTNQKPAATPYHYFLKFNAAAWRKSLTPLKDPDAERPANGNYAWGATATGLPRAIQVSVLNPDDDSIWLAALSINPNYPYALNPTEIATLELFDGSSDKLLLIRDLEPSEYEVQLTYLKRDGFTVARTALLTAFATP